MKVRLKKDWRSHQRGDVIEVKEIVGKSLVMAEVGYELPKKGKRAPHDKMVRGAQDKSNLDSRGAPRSIDPVEPDALRSSDVIRHIRNNDGR